MRYASDLLQTADSFWRTLLNSHLFQKNKAPSVARQVQNCFLNRQISNSIGFEPLYRRLTISPQL